ncbi:unnamed protein product [Dicrocoelium dendriticum]|nr:unnamed protein product [Dicrocoelium dendriticum]
MSSSITCFYLGRVHYTPAWMLQKAIVQILKSSDEACAHTILFLEHNPVYTLGVRSHDPTNDYSEASIRNLTQLGAEFIKTDRGGLITYHGPGQLVAYPIINLRCKYLAGHGIRWFVNALELAGVNLCARFHLKASPGSGLNDTGVWLNSLKKVMAIGVHKSDSITYHGVALNCSNDPLPWLRRIVPCGLIGRDVTSLSEACKREISVASVSPIFATCLIDHLFGLPDVRQNHVTISHRFDLANEWTSSSSSLCHVDGAVLSWSLAVNNILAEVRSRMVVRQTADSTL